MTAIELAIRDAYWGNVTQLATVQLAMGLSNAEAARLCFVSPETYKRWRLDRKPNPAGVRLLAIHAGYMPWDGWTTCRIVNGRLYTQHDYTRGYDPTEVASIDFFRTGLDGLRYENRRLRRLLEHTQGASEGGSGQQWGSQ